MADPITPGANIADRLAALIVAQKLTPVMFPSGAVVLVPPPGPDGFSITMTFNSGDGAGNQTVSVSSGPKAAS